MRLTVISALFLIAGNASAEGWLCVADSGTGFILEGANWVAAEVNVETHRYEIRPADEYDLQDATWMVTRADSGGIVAVTNEELTEEGYVIHFKDRLAKGLAFDFRFNPSALKFQLVYFMGYYIGTDDSRLTPFMEIGRCSHR